MPFPSPASAGQGGWRAYLVDVADDSAALQAAAARARALGFNVLVAEAASPAAPAADDRQTIDDLGRFAAVARSRGLRPWARVVLDRVAQHHPLAREASANAFAAPAPQGWEVVDPRRPIARDGGELMLRRASDPALAAWWRAALKRLIAAGVEGFVQLGGGESASKLVRRLTLDGLALQLVSRRPAPTQAPIGLVATDDAQGADDERLRLALAALGGCGWLLCGATRAAPPKRIRTVNAVLSETDGLGAPIEDWCAPRDRLVIRSRPSGEAGVVLARNRGPTPLPWPPTPIAGLPWSRFEPLPGFEPSREGLAPGETVLCRALQRPSAVALFARTSAQSAADRSRRIRIARVAPSVDDGASPIKALIGEETAVEADIFIDGHEPLAAAIEISAGDGGPPLRRRLIAQPNDLWVGAFTLEQLGAHSFHVEAWLDVWGGFVRDLRKKREAGRDVALEIREGRGQLRRTLERARGSLARPIAAALEGLNGAPDAVAVERLLDARLAEAVRALDDRPFLTRSFAQAITVERRAAGFSSWYELFPRSQAGDGARHGAFADVARKLPHIAAMGFDTLYFPPIHPIGETNRKGPNNSLVAPPGAVGSPYAIGSAEGGHTAVHPQLGALEDFRILLARARRLGLEIAIDFAIQCSPDHPWLKAHAEWFDWRDDGSIKFAENPPKTYEDIVNVDFYAPGAVPSLWNALRDVVLFWAGQGVKAFRVDNPHTKPAPFWRWLIAEVKARHPDAIFLAEAFTRPGPLLDLAKLGFSQSYTYFTWRHSKRELEAYLTELNASPARDVLRPHFFVNTPDINPRFLQASGRPGFLIRAALAATLSGLFGIYAGFELCEAAAPPGREEYLDSEKYQIRARPDRAAGDIVDEISQLNRIRREQPALHSHRGLSFHNAFNDQVLYFSKTAPGRADRILVAVSLDPFAAQSADFELPLWLFGKSDGESLQVEDLLTGRRQRWTGKLQRVRLEPERPYAIWRLSAEEG